MRQLKFLQIFFILSLAPQWGQASELFVTMTSEVIKSRLSLSTEFAQLSVEDEAISSVGGRVSYSHQLWNQVDADILLASTLSTADGIKPGTTTLGLYGMYNIFNAVTFEKNLKVNGSPFLIDKGKVKDQLRIGVGVEQTFLSGNRGVYSSAGPGVQINYERMFWDTRFLVGARSAELYSGDLKITAMMFNLGVVFDY